MNTSLNADIAQYTEAEYGEAMAEYWCGESRDTSFSLHHISLTTSSHYQVIKEYPQAGQNFMQPLLQCLQSRGAAGGSTGQAKSHI